MNELADIVGRIIPDVPLPENEKNPQDAVNDKDEKQDKDLQEIQKEQSNDKIQ